jgi:hypothetical protein
MIPTPGSSAAIRLGCTCTAWENGWGAGRIDGSFHVRAGCPVHLPPAWTAEDQARWAIPGDPPDVHHDVHEDPTRPGVWHVTTFEHDAAGKPVRVFGRLYSGPGAEGRARDFVRRASA